jgi:hypothetical protein
MTSAAERKTVELWSAVFRPAVKVQVRRSSSHDEW